MKIVTGNCGKITVSTMESSKHIGSHAESPRLRARRRARAARVPSAPLRADVMQQRRVVI